MIEIGTFEVTNDGFRGRIRTLCLDIEIVIQALGSRDGKPMEFAVRRGPDAFGTHVGRGLRRADDVLGECIILLLDDPSFAAPVRAKLYPSILGGGQHDLFWSEPTGRWMIG